MKTTEGAATGRHGYSRQRGRFSQSVGAIRVLYAPAVPALTLTCAKTVSKPYLLGRGELLFERKQFPQVVDKRHFRVELLEHLEPEIILHTQEVRGSSPCAPTNKRLVFNRLAVFGCFEQSKEDHKTVSKPGKTYQNSSRQPNRPLLDWDLLLYWIQPPCFSCSSLPEIA